MEEFRELPQYPGYRIGNQGTILGLYGNPLKPNIIKSGYMRVFCGDVDKKELVHRLVAMAFIPNPNDYPFVDHINRERTDNRVVNLKWIDAIGNAQNRTISCNNSTGINGLTFNKIVQSWYVRKTINGVHYQKSFKERPDAELYLQQILSHE